MAPECKTEERNVNTDHKIAHLQLLQEPIGRMSSMSAIYKGFSAAILAGLASASFTNMGLWALIIGLVPLGSFLCLDVFYLRLERKMRYRYNRVADGKDAIDFKINLKLDPEEEKEANATITGCLKSKSIWMFYGPTLLCAAALIVLKFMGIL